VSVFREEGGDRTVVAEFRGLSRQTREGTSW
jgi:hypothetical protein